MNFLKKITLFSLALGILGKVLGDGVTVLRGGYGIACEQVPRLAARQPDGLQSAGHLCEQSDESAIADQSFL